MTFNEAILAAIKHLPTCDECGEPATRSYLYIFGPVFTSYLCNRQRCMELSEHEPGDDRKPCNASEVATKLTDYLRTELDT